VGLDFSAVRDTVRKTNSILFSIILVLVISICPNIVLAQSRNNFATYSNKTYRFSIQYPSDWEVKENDLISAEDVVEFTAPDRSDFTVQVSEPTSYLDTDTMTLKNLTLQQQAQSRLDMRSELAFSPGWSFKEIGKNEITVSGLPAWKIEYTSGYAITLYHFEVLTTANGKIYTLEYYALPSNVPKTFPVANNMVDTFHITPYHN
jgi:hypothetical protein